MVTKLAARMSCSHGTSTLDDLAQLLPINLGCFTQLGLSLMSVMAASVESSSESHGALPSES
eukprot:3981364-Amphidinium_carterae.1